MFLAFIENIIDGIIETIKGVITILITYICNLIPTIAKVSYVAISGLIGFLLIYYAVLYFVVR